MLPAVLAFCPSMLSLERLDIILVWNKRIVIHADPPCSSRSGLLQQAEVSTILLVNSEPSPFYDPLGAKKTVLNT